MLLAIDPGRCTGFAFFGTLSHETAQGLAYCGVCDVNNHALVSTAAHYVICELPQVYRAALSKGDPNDLIKVAVEVGQWKERAHARAIPFETVLPAEWKGTVPKEIHHARARAALLPQELSRIPALPKDKAHNMWDAIALGLWKLGRLKR